MKTSFLTSRATKSIAALLTLAALTLFINPAHAATPTYSSWHYSTLHCYGVNPKGGWATGGHLTLIEPIRADGLGGSLYAKVTVPGKPVRKYRFTWTFDKDVTNVYQGVYPLIKMSVQGDAGDSNPFMYAKGTHNTGGQAEWSEAQARVYWDLKGTYSPSTSRPIAYPLMTSEPTYGFKIIFADIDRTSDSLFEIDYDYTGVQAAAPPAVSPMASTPGYFYIYAGNAYYTFTKSSNSIIYAPYPSGAGWTFNYVSNATMGGVTPGVIVKQAGGTLCFWIANKGAGGAYANRVYYNYGGNSWTYYTGMLGVQ